MPRYQYLIGAVDPRDPRRMFEVQQRMSDPPLTRHPDTDEPVQRLISGGNGAMLKNRSGRVATRVWEAEHAPSGPSDPMLPLAPVARGCRTDCECC